MLYLEREQLEVQHALGVPPAAEHDLQRVFPVLEARVAALETIEPAPDCALGHCILLARSADVGDRGAVSLPSSHS
ncbi:unnamed protein product [Heligmosomoides polygyrus]|uniref:Transcriptional regulator n=1 Tax=Heligmosomoides polygyrus TaxID=6339 RepID=A0A183GDB8_HELPZ|nr:unnamed protein product [Heligmosomoides polygyrus]